jgi:ankyrin repeat protein
LINKGASPNERDSEGNFCINLACDNRKIKKEVIELLFKHGASANSRGKYDRQPLHLVCDQYNCK